MHVRHIDGAVRVGDDGSVSIDDAGNAPLFDVGDRVVAAQGIGGMLRPRVRRGEHGIVVSRTLRGELAVRFANGPTERVDAGWLDPGPPMD